MTPAWMLTLEEWETLPQDQKDKHPSVGARPYHTNYHLIAVGTAIRDGKPVPDRVIKSYPSRSSQRYFEDRAYWRDNSERE